MIKRIQILALLVFGFLFYSQSNAQIKGIEEPKKDRDTVFVFKSPRPLLQNNGYDDENTWAWGADFLLSNSGFGLGAFYQRLIKDDLFAIASLYISGARNTDELELPNYEQNRYEVPGKINRLFMFPLTFGLQQYLFKDILQENLKPFINAGIGITWILSAPYKNYENAFFSSFAHTNSYIRYAAFIGLGANIGTVSNSLIGVNIKYYYIPFGKNGLESIINHPIKDFGGIFLSLSVGKMF